MFKSQEIADLAWMPSLSQNLGRVSNWGLIPACQRLARPKQQLEQLQFLEAGPVPSHNLFLSLAPELRIPTLGSACPSY